MQSNYHHPDFLSKMMFEIYIVKINTQRLPYIHLKTTLFISDRRRRLLLTQTRRCRLPRRALTP
jgi:hypothetical protein